MPKHAVVVGASLGGLRVAEQLRSQGWQGEITVVGAEPYMPYNRPPLSKQVLRADEGGPSEIHAELAFSPRSSAATVQWRLGRPAVGADLEERTVTLGDDSLLRYDVLVVASGLSPRRLRCEGAYGSRHVIRTLDDAVRLRAALHSSSQVVIAGGGLIGCEVAATARLIGAEVTVIEPTEGPMAAVAGPAFSRAIREHHEARGIRFALGRTVGSLETKDDSADGELRAVVLDDGSSIEADVLVEAVGAAPNVEWLDGNGLDLRNGVLCDNAMRVENASEVFAVGDVAAFPNPLFDDVPRRVEHWSMAAETAKRAAASIVAENLDGAADAERPFTPLPMFWSDQLDLRLQGLGQCAVGERWEVLDGDLEGDEPFAGAVAAGAFTGERLVGVILAGETPARVLQFRNRIAGAYPIAQT